MREFFLGILFCLPMMRGMRDVKLPELKASAAELSLTLIFSLLPMWLVLIVAFISTDYSIGQTFEKMVREGFLLIYAATLIGPSLYWVLKDYSDLGEVKRMPHQITIVSFIALTCLFASVVYILVTPLGAANESIVAIDDVRVGALSGLFVVISIFSLFIFQSYKNFLEPNHVNSPEEINRARVEKLSSKLGEVEYD